MPSTRSGDIQINHSTRRELSRWVMWLALTTVPWLDGCTSEPAAQRAESASGVPQGTPTVDQVLERHAAAVGGKPAWDALQCRTVRYSVKIRGGPDANGDPIDIDGTTVVQRRAPNRILTVTTIPDAGAFEQGFDGKVGWMRSPRSTARRIPEGQLQELAREAQFAWECDLRQGYQSATLVGPFQIHDTTCWQVRLADDKGGTADVFLDQKTGLCVAISRILSAGGQPMQVTRYLYDYRKYGSILLASRTEQTLGTNTQTEQITDVEFTPIPDAVFALPSGLNSN